MNPDRLLGPSGPRLAAVLAAGALALAGCTARLAPPTGVQALAPPSATADEAAADDQGGAVPPTFDRHGRTRDHAVGIGPLPLLDLRF